MKHTFIAILLLALCSACTTMTTPKATAKPAEHEESVAYLSDIEKRIAMFIIPLNYNTNGTYTEFELKGSTNNFYRVRGSWNTPAVREGENTCLQYYSQSEFADIGVKWSETNQVHSTSLDKMYLFACTYSGEAPAGTEALDERSYTYIGNTASWTNQPIFMVALVDTECLYRHSQDPNKPQDDWLINTNEELVWCYTRYYQGSGNSPEREKEQGSDKVLWRPTAPVRWFKKMPKWATDQINQP